MVGKTLTANKKNAHLYALQALLQALFYRLNAAPARRAGPARSTLPGSRDTGQRTISIHKKRKELAPFNVLSVPNYPGGIEGANWTRMTRSHRKDITGIRFAFNPASRKRKIDGFLSKVEGVNRQGTENNEDQQEFLACLDRIAAVRERKVNPEYLQLAETVLSARLHLGDNREMFAQRTGVTVWDLLEIEHAAMRGEKLAACVAQIDTSAGTGLARQYAGLLEGD